MENSGLKYSRLASTDLIQEAKRHAIYDEFKNSFQKILRNGDHHLLFEDSQLLEDLKQVQTMAAYLKKQKDIRSPYVLLTINFPDYNPKTGLGKTQIQQVVDLPIRGMFDTVWCKYAMWTLEFHNDKGEYTHPHYHILLTLRNMFKKKSEIIRETFNKVNKYVKINKESIDFKYHKTCENAKKYIKGKKAKSLAGVEKDKEWLDSYGLEKYYKADYDRESLTRTVEIVKDVLDK